VTPNSNFDLKGGRGAFEAKARFAAVDLEDDGLAGGEGDDITLGVNWHLNSNTRVMLEYVTHDRDGVGDVQAIQFRFQIDF